MNELWCQGCKDHKHGGLFTASQRLKPEGFRLCMACQKRTSKANRAKYKIKGNSAAWANGIFFLPGTKY
jgi:hypothetical protein